MSIITGIKQRVRTYQILSKDNNNFILNNDNFSNLINLNIDSGTFNDAIINFKNIYHIGSINNKFTILNNNNKSNLLTIDNDFIDIYKNLNVYSNINVNNYLYTSIADKTTYFNNNLLINLDDYSNLKVINNSTPLFELNKNNLNINTNTNFNSNVFMNPNTTFYTNFIDSPNNKPVIINNMAFAESLRILTNNIIHNISIDNSVLWCNIYRFISDDQKIIPTDDISWRKYMINNNVNLNDIYFTAPNINVNKYTSPINNIGGSNILEFKTLTFNNNNPKLVLSINNNGFINIGSNYTSNIPINININPTTSNCYNIFNYLNKNNSNYITTINSNGYINIGSNSFTNNQINISKNINSNLNNTELLSLNINTTNFNTYNGSYQIDFINNDDYNNFIFKTINYIEEISSGINQDNYDIVITNPFIENNISNINKNIYTNNINYNLRQINKNNSGFSDTIINRDNFTKFYIPNNLFDIYSNVKSVGSINLDYYICPINLNINNNIQSFYNNNLNSFNKIVIKNRYIYTFYIYKSTYSYNYNGIYLPKITDCLKFTSNNKINFSISAYGNIGIGTNYNDIYKLYIPENALINNINCSTVDNLLYKSINYCNCSLTNINNINSDIINVNNIYSINNITSNMYVLNSQLINSNLTVLNNINVSSNIFIRNSTNNSIILNSNININNNINSINPNITINTISNSIPSFTLNNNINKYDIIINSNNNFQLILNNSTSIIRNNYIDNSISLLERSFNIFRDMNSNIKIFAGRPNTINDNSIDGWYDYISPIGKNVSIPSTFYIYGNLNFNKYNDGTPIINAYNNNNNYLKIGIGTINTDIGNSNLLNINMNTNFNSNVSVNNDIYLKGTLLSPSDINIKTDIKLISSPLEKINKINGYTYKRTDTGNYETGLIAQEVMDILPEVIKYNNDIYNISYGNMCGLLVEAIKELNKKIEKLENK